MSPKLRTYFRRMVKDVPNKENQLKDQKRIQRTAAILRQLEAEDQGA